MAGKSSELGNWKRPRRKGRTANEQFAAARDFIKEAIKERWTNLDFSVLGRLKEIPPELASCDWLGSADFSFTKVTDLGPLIGLKNLQSLLLAYSPVREISPLAELPALQSLRLTSTGVLDLSPLSKLSLLDSLWLSRTTVSDIAPLSQLSKLTTLWIDDTRVTDIRPLAALPLKNLSLAGTAIEDFTALTKIVSLETLSLGNTGIKDLALLAELKSLEGLSLANTSVTDLTTVAKLTALKRLRLDNSKVVDLTPIGRGLSLESLAIDQTKIRDLTPIARMTSLQDAAMKRGGALSFKGSKLAMTAPFRRLEKLGEPGRTVETINEVRRKVGLSDYIPKGYSPNIRAFDPDIYDEEHNQEQLTQKPASHSFIFQGGRIEAQSQAFTARHPEVAADIRGEVSEKAKETCTRLASCNAPRRIASTVARLDASLGTSLENVRAGILQMRFRSLEADVAAYDTEEGRKELPEDALAMLRDLASSVEDLMGCFPQLADIEAERLAQRLKDADVPQIVEALSQIRNIAEQSEAVAPSAIEALRAGEPELEHDAEILDSGASEAARIAAGNARDRTVGYMLLVYRNFIAGTIKAGSELVGLGSETWKDFRQKAPEQFANAAIALIVAGLVNGLLGPTAAVGAFALSFKPLRDRAKRVADKLVSIAKKATDASAN